MDWQNPQNDEVVGDIGQITKSSPPLMNLDYSLGDVEIVPTANTTKTKKKKHPLLLPEIMEMIFMYLDPTSAYTSRLVCRVWNGAAVDVISKHHPPHFDLLPVFKPGPTMEDLSRFLPIIQNSDAPRVLMQTFECPAELLANENKVEQLFQEFGWTLKSLVLNSCYAEIGLTLRLLRRILMEWSPDLEELVLFALNNTQYHTKFDDLTMLDLGQHKLNLKRLSVSACVTKSDWDSDLHLLLSIIKASPNLTFLQHQVKDPTFFKTFFTELKCLPEITNNLEELWIEVFWHATINQINILLDVEFSPKLKSLTLESVCSGGALRRNEMSLLLNKLGSFLEELSIYSNFDKRIPKNVQWRLLLPMMPQLRSFINMADNDYRLHSVDFLEKMPNLKTLVLAGGYRGEESDLIYLSEGRADALLFSSENANKTTFLSLRELTLLGNIHSDITPSSINKRFPNLSKLYVALEDDGHGHCHNDKDTAEEWLENVFGGFSEMQHLKELQIDLEGYDWLEEDGIKINLTNAFSKLEDMPSLECLTFINGNFWDIHSDKLVGNAGRMFVRALDDLLSHARPLKLLKLISFKMHLSDSRSLFEVLEKHKHTRVKFPKIHPWKNYYSRNCRFYQLFE